MVLTAPAPTPASRAIPDADIPGYVARTYLDSLRYGAARSYWYAWTPEYRPLGIQMWNGCPATPPGTTILTSLDGATTAVGAAIAVSGTPVRTS